MGRPASDISNVEAADAGERAVTLAFGEYEYEAVNKQTKKKEKRVALYPKIKNVRQALVFTWGKANVVATLPPECRVYSKDERHSFVALGAPSDETYLGEEGKSFKLAVRVPPSALPHMERVERRLYSMYKEHLRKGAVRKIEVAEKNFEQVLAEARVVVHGLVSKLETEPSFDLDRVFGVLGTSTTEFDSAIRSMSDKRASGGGVQVKSDDEDVKKFLVSMVDHRDILVGVVRKVVPAFNRVSGAKTTLEKLMEFVDTNFNPSLRPVFIKTREKTEDGTIGELRKSVYNAAGKEITDPSEIEDLDRRIQGYKEDKKFAPWDAMFSPEHRDLINYFACTFNMPKYKNAGESEYSSPVYKNTSKRIYGFKDVEATTPDGTTTRFTQLDVDATEDRAMSPLDIKRGDMLYIRWKKSSAYSIGESCGFLNRPIFIRVVNCAPDSPAEDGGDDEGDKDGDDDDMFGGGGGNLGDGVSFTTMRTFAMKDETDASAGGGGGGGGDGTDGSGAGGGGVDWGEQEEILKLIGHTKKRTRDEAFASDATDGPGTKRPRTAM